jgi:sugar O-acyltransferase (sialic acid O-acetyltransferase NeuD family)
MTVHFGLIGAGGSGREVMPYAAASVARQLSVPESEVRTYFVESWEPGQAECNGRPLMSLQTFLGLTGERYFNVAIGDGAAREKVATEIGQHARPLSIFSATATILDENVIESGAVLCSNATVTSNTRIGVFFHGNMYSCVHHDCVIGDFVTFAPGARCNGRVHVDNYAYIGAHAVIKEGTPKKPLKIGARSVVGMGAVVTKDVPSGVTVVGNPARILIK